MSCSTIFHIIDNCDIIIKFYKFYHCHKCKKKSIFSLHQTPWNESFEINWIKNPIYLTHMQEIKRLFILNLNAPNVIGKYFSFFFYYFFDRYAISGCPIWSNIFFLLQIKNVFSDHFYVKCSWIKNIFTYWHIYIHICWLNF